MQLLTNFLRANFHEIFWKRCLPLGTHLAFSHPPAPPPPPVYTHAKKQNSTIHSSFCIRYPGVKFFENFTWRASCWIVTPSCKVHQTLWCLPVLPYTCTGSKAGILMSRSHPKHRIATRTSHCLGYQIHTICTWISARGAGSSPPPPPPPTHTHRQVTCVFVKEYEKADTRSAIHRISA